MGKIIVYLDDSRLIDSDVEVLADTVISAGLNLVANNEFIGKGIITFHQTLDMNILNSFVSSEPELYSNELVDKAEEILEDIYEEKCIKKREVLIAQRKAVLERKPIYSSPAILAFAHSVVTTYPELIHEVGNPLYIQRAFNFINGSYTYMLNRAMDPPVVCLHYRKTDGVDDLMRELVDWTKNCCAVAKILAIQYGVTGDEKYLALMDNLYIFKDNKLHRKIIAIRINYERSLSLSEERAEEVSAADICRNNGKYGMKELFPEGKESADQIQKETYCGANNIFGPEQQLYKPVSKIIWNCIGGVSKSSTFKQEAKKWCYSELEAVRPEGL
jgi:hypothetical protein